MILLINIGSQLKEVLENLNDLIVTGKIRYVGLSNETPWGMMKFLEKSKEKNLATNDVNSKCL